MFCEVRLGKLGKVGCYAIAFVWKTVLQEIDRLKYLSEALSQTRYRTGVQYAYCFPCKFPRLYEGHLKEH